MEEGQTVAGATTPQSAPKPPTEAVPSGRDVVVVLDKGSAPPQSSGGRDVVMAWMSEPVPVVMTADFFLAAEVPEPSLAAEVPGSSLIAEVAESSSVRGAVTVEEVMELATCRYIDFPGVGGY
jgi:hypothetical protein